MKKKAALNTKLCFLTGKDLNTIPSMKIMCNNEAVSKEFILQYTHQFLRKQEEPPCPFCRQTNHFKKDLENNNIQHTPFNTTNMTYEDFQTILNSQDVFFAALNIKNIHKNEDKIKACKRLIIIFHLRDEINSDVDKNKTKLIHILCELNQIELIQISIEDYNMSYNEITLDGKTPISIAENKQFTKLKEYLEKL